MLDFSPFLDDESGILWLAKHLVSGGEFNTKSLYLLNILTSLYQNGHENVYQRTPREGHRGLNQGGRRNVKAAFILRGCAASGLCESRDEQPSGYTKEQEIIGRWAEKEGCWYDYADSYLKSQGMRNLGYDGSESNVYYNPKDKRIYKIIDGRHYSCDLTKLMDRISIFNSYFPEAGLKVVGFGMKDDAENLSGFSVIVSQPYIVGDIIDKNSLYKDLLVNRGLHDKSPSFSPRYYYNKSETFRFYDLHDLNAVLVKHHGVSNTIVFDCDCSINEAKFRIPLVKGSQESVEKIDNLLSSITPVACTLLQTKEFLSTQYRQQLSEMEDGEIISMNFGLGLSLVQKKEDKFLFLPSEKVADILRICNPDLSETQIQEISFTGRTEIQGGSELIFDLTLGETIAQASLTKNIKLSHRGY